MTRALTLNAANKSGNCIPKIDGEYWLGQEIPDAFRDPLFDVFHGKNTHRPEVLLYD